MRSKGEIEPSVVVTDNIGYVYEDDGTGEYKRTTGLIQRLEDAELISKSENLTDREKKIGLLKYDPEFFLHQPVFQPFDDVVYEGIVKYCDKDSKTSRTFWNVLYSDGKSGDLWDDEMIKWNIDREAGSLCGPQVTKTSHPKSSSSSSNVSTNNAQASNRPEPYGHSGGDSSLREKDGTFYVVDSSICEQYLAEHDAYYTSHDDSFKDVCAATRLHKSQWPLYYQWVHENFMRGELFLTKLFFLCVILILLKENNPTKSLMKLKPLAICTLLVPFYGVFVIVTLRFLKGFRNFAV
eukprot:COSAG02_NODE_2904_length_7775_cov_45.519802_3_plen_295_part_00